MSYDLIKKTCLNNGVVFFYDFHNRKRFVGGGFDVAVGLDVSMWNHKGIINVVEDPACAVKEVFNFKQELLCRKKRTKGVRESISDCQRFLDTVGKDLNYTW